MEEVKANQLFMKFKDSVPSNKQVILKQAIDAAPDTAFDQVSKVNLKNPTTTLIISILFGAWDRVYLGQIGGFFVKLILSMITGGIYWIVDIFKAKKRTKEVNFDKIMKALV